MITTKWNEIRGTFFAKNKAKETIPEKFNDYKTLLPDWFIYSSGKRESYADHLNRFHFVHYILKFKIIEPFILLFYKLFHKKIDQDIPDYWYNNNLQLFSDSYDNAIKLWITKFLSLRPHVKKELEEKGLDYVFHNDRSCRLLQIFKKISISIILNDTSLKEFFNFWNYQLFMDMQKKYKHIKEINHLMYSADHPVDINYYVVGDAIKKYFEGEQICKKQIKKF